jgi:Fur family ferric uptake transcriptional regulator
MQRTTKQRSAIRKATEESGRPLLPQEILALAQKTVPQLNLATVYRNLNVMVEEGEVTPVHLPEQPTRFEKSGQHHHHFLCRKCERVFDIHQCSEDISRLVPTGFEVDDHNVILYGSCPSCKTGS